MDKNFYLKCDALLKILPKEITMEPTAVREYLNVSYSYARTVIDQLRSDGLAGGYGTGPISKNDKTETYKDYYTQKIKSIKQESRKITTAIWSSWIAIILSTFALILEIASR